MKFFQQWLSINTVHKKCFQKYYLLDTWDETDVSWKQRNQEKCHLRSDFQSTSNSVKLCKTFDCVYLGYINSSNEISLTKTFRAINHIKTSSHLSAKCVSIQVANIDSEETLSAKENFSFQRVTERTGERNWKTNFNHILFFTSHMTEGLGYSMFSHGNLSKALEMKTPPPLNMTSDGRRIDAHSGLCGTRSNLANAVRESTKVLTYTQKWLTIHSRTLLCHCIWLKYRGRGNFILLLLLILCKYIINKCSSCSCIFKCNYLWKYMI